MDNETLRSIQILALQSVDKPTYEDFYRNVCRWFSNTYSTPLKSVEGMADQYVLQHYYEVMYAEIRDADGDNAKDHYDRLKSTILQTENETTNEENDDEQWAREINEEIEKQAKAITSKAMEEIDNHIKEIQQNGESLDEFQIDDEDEDE